uniref:Uncharacterized protein n=1 Tax=Lepeophtheirus salmonis TaxID=72036 RepID=A0A0K2SWT4_LEPSM
MSFNNYNNGYQSLIYIVDQSDMYMEDGQKRNYHKHVPIIYVDHNRTELNIKIRYDLIHEKGFSADRDVETKGYIYGCDVFVENINDFHSVASLVEIAETKDSSEKLKQDHLNEKVFINDHNNYCQKSTRKYLNNKGLKEFKRRKTSTYVKRSYAQPEDFDFFGIQQCE